MSDREFDYMNYVESAFMQLRKDKRWSIDALDKFVRVVRPGDNIQSCILECENCCDRFTVELSDVLCWQESRVAQPQAL